MTATTSAVLLLGWDDVSLILPVAEALAPHGTRLWTEQPTAAALPPSSTAQELGGARLPAPPLALITRNAPAYPYVGTDPSSTPTARYARPAAPYVGSSAEAIDHPPTPWADAGPAPRTAATPVPAAEGPARHQIGTAGASSATATNGSIGTGLAPTVETSLPTAEPGPAEAAALSYEQVLGVLAETPAAAEQAAAGADRASAQAAPAEEHAEASAAAAAAPATTSSRSNSPEPGRSPASMPRVAPPTPGADDEDEDLNFRIIQYARQAVRLAYDGDFEAIFAPAWPTWLAGVELRLLTRRPLIVQLAELTAEQPDLPGRGWREALERLALTRADRIFVPDAAVAARVNQRYRLPVGRTIVLPPAAAPDLRAALVLETPFSA